VRLIAGISNGQLSESAAFQHLDDRRHVLIQRRAEELNI
jgi:hypothetical protein